MAMLLKRSAFIHIPKTGGTTIKAAMRRAGVKMRLSGNDSMDVFSERQHACYRDVEDEIDGRAVFASIRNTKGWYSSIWCHHKREGTGNGATGPEHWNERFEPWFWGVIDKLPGHYGKFLNGMLGEAASPMLIRTSHLLQDLCATLTICGEDYDIKKLVNTPSANVAAKEKSLVVWTSEMEQALSDSEGAERYPEIFLDKHRGQFLA